MLRRCRVLTHASQHQPGRARHRSRWRFHRRHGIDPIRPPTRPRCPRLATRPLVRGVYENPQWHPRNCKLTCYVSDLAALACSSASRRLSRDCSPARCADLFGRLPSPVMPGPGQRKIEEAMGVRMLEHLLPVSADTSGIHYQLDAGLRYEAQYGSPWAVTARLRRAALHDEYDYRLGSPRAVQPRCVRRDRRIRSCPRFGGQGSSASPLRVCARR